MEWTNQMILLAGVLFLSSILASVITPRLGIPVLLVFLIVGMIAGEDGPGGISFDNYPLANLAASAALAVVLFDGGMRTPLTAFRVGLRPALVLSTFGVLLTTGIVGAFSAWLLDLSLAEGLLIGAIVGSTDAAAVFSLLQTNAVSLNQRVSSALEIESGTNDPMAVFLTLALISYLQQPEVFGIGAAIGLLIQQMTLGTVIGLAGGWLLANGLNRLPLGDSLYPLLALFGAMLVFGLTGVLGGSGFLAVYLSGLFIGNRQVRAAASIRRFHDGVAWMAQIGMFVILGLLATPSNLTALVIPGLLVSAVLIVLARPLAVWLSLLPFRFPVREQAYIAWVGLRGSVPILLATYPWIAGLEHAVLFFNIAFFIVLVSMVVQGSTVATAARLLRLQVPSNSARVHRLDVDLPGQRGFEVVSYRLARNSSLTDARPKDLPLPDVSRIVCISRHGRVLHAREWGTLKVGDYISILTPQHQLPALDRLFESVTLPADSPGRRFYGEFSIHPDALVADLCMAYGCDIPDGAEALTVANLLIRHLPHPVVGDRLRLGELQLVVREVRGDTPTQLGLRLPH